MIDDQKWKEILANVNTKKDGVISFDEF